MVRLWHDILLLQKIMYPVSYKTEKDIIATIWVMGNNKSEIEDKIKRYQFYDELNDYSIGPVYTVLINPARR